jgi:hypothetical protein
VHVVIGRAQQRLLPSNGFLIRNRSSRKYGFLVGKCSSRLYGFLVRKRSSRLYGFLVRKCRATLRRIFGANVFWVSGYCNTIVWSEFHVSSVQSYLQVPGGELSRHGVSDVTCMSVLYNCTCKYQEVSSQGRASPK